MSEFLWYCAGVLTWPALAAGIYLVDAALWAWRDTVEMCRYAELKPGYSRWNWMWIAPRKFAETFWRTLTNRLGGLQRTG